jgi:ubiquinone/menaquinone biosynthesis C-methylase UbiE
VTEPSAGSPEIDTAMVVEFDDMAEWTRKILNALPAEYAIPAACRGSASPGSLHWLGQAMGLHAGMSLLDIGAGMGGPSAFARSEFGVQPILLEPMPGACLAASNLFGLAVVQADAHALPFANATFEAAWALGVLCTSSRPHLILAELRRVLRPNAPLGLLAFVKSHSRLSNPPEGNDFPLMTRLTDLLDHAGFQILSQVDTVAFAEPPPEWRRQAKEIDDRLAARYGRNPRWQVAQQQGERMNKLLKTGAVTGHLLNCRATG